MLLVESKAPVTSPAQEGEGMHRRAACWQHGLSGGQSGGVPDKAQATSECGAGESVRRDAGKGGAGRKKAPITSLVQSVQEATCRAWFMQQLPSLAAGQAALNSMKALAAKSTLDQTFDQT